MASVTLSEKQLRYLRGRAHALNPVIQLGQAGLTPGVRAETARALIGKSSGEVVDVAAPGRTRSYEIVSVKYL